MRMRAESDDTRMLNVRFIEEVPGVYYDETFGVYHDEIYFMDCLLDEGKGSYEARVRLSKCCNK